MKKTLKGFGKLIGLAAAAGAGYYLYERYLEEKEYVVEVEPIKAEDILEMFKAKGFKMLVSSENTMLHIINDDKTEAIQVKSDEGAITQIQYYPNNDGANLLKTVYSNGSEIIDEEMQQHFRNRLGSLGVTEKRFISFAQEVLNNPELCELTL